MNRHGDVIIREVESIPANAVLVKGRKELAYGEKTGHAHRIDIGELFETKGGKLYFRADKNTKLSHEEHKTIILEPKYYEIVIKRQYTSDGWERVAD